MNTRDFHKLNLYILKFTGMNIPESNVSTVEAFVEDRLERCGVTVDNYLNMLSKDSLELRQFLSGITINETYFFREEKQFLLMRDVLMEEWSRKKKAPLRMWSASCSTGEESLSLYAMMKKHYPHPFRLLASDVSQAVLDRFQTGEYRLSSLRKDGQSLKPLLDSMVVSRNDRDFRIDPEVLRQIEQKRINVFQDDLSDLPAMDLILFRNTLIYMSPHNKEKVIYRLADKLLPGGVLFLSVSETPLISHNDLVLEEVEGIYFFRKKTAVSNALSTNAQSVKIQETSLNDFLKQERKKEPIRKSGIKKSTPVRQRKTPRKKQGTQMGYLDLCRLISKYLNSSIEDLEMVPAVVKSYLDLLFLLEERNLKKAWEFLAVHRDIKDFDGLYRFFLGYLHYSDHHSALAFKEFREALKSAPALWPARFYLTRSAENRMSPGQKERELRRILNDIREYIRDDRFDFQFLLEGFNARYFQMICTRELETLQRRSDRYAHR